MTIPLIPKPEFPTVPNVPGVPPLPRSPSFPAPTEAFASDDGQNIPANSDARVWGVFTADGAEAFDVDTYTQVNPTNDVKVSNFPVEDGSFASFNKVQNPNEVKVRVSVGNSLPRLTALLDVTAAMVNSVDLFSVVTPYETFVNMTCKRRSYTQTGQNGANRLDVELSFEEVRQVTPAFTTAALPPAVVKNPASAATQNTGKQQPAAPKKSVASGLVNGVSNWLKK